MSEFDSSFVFMPLERSAGLFQPRWRRERHRDLHRRSRPDAGRASTGSSRTHRDPLVLIDWRQRNRTFFNALEVERNVMFIILT
jgi:lipoprotein-releasing system permease protein